MKLGPDNRVDSVGPDQPVGADFEAAGESRTDSRFVMREGEQPLADLKAAGWQAIAQAAMEIRAMKAKGRRVIAAHVHG